MIYDFRLEKIGKFAGLDDSIEGACGPVVRALDSESKGPESVAGQHLVPLGKVLYSNCGLENHMKI